MASLRISDYIHHVDYGHGDYRISRLVDGAYALSWGDVVFGGVISVPPSNTDVSGVRVFAEYADAVAAWKRLPDTLTNDGIAAEMLAEVA